VTRPQSSPNRFMAQTSIAGLSECQDSVLATQIFIEHLK
jgi:hypothetical protein